MRLQVPLKVLQQRRQADRGVRRKRRNPLTYDQIPQRMIQAFLSAEDTNFFEHPGVDYRGLLRAGVQLALTGKKKQGGSTITMQVARNFYQQPEDIHAQTQRDLPRPAYREGTEQT